MCHHPHHQPTENWSNNSEGFHSKFYKFCPWIQLFLLPTWAHGVQICGREISLPLLLCRARHSHCCSPNFALFYQIFPEYPIVFLKHFHCICISFLLHLFLTFHWEIWIATIWPLLFDEIKHDIRKAQHNTLWDCFPIFIIFSWDSLNILRHKRTIFKFYGRIADNSISGFCLWIRTSRIGVSNNDIFLQNIHFTKRSWKTALKEHDLN